MYAAKYGGSASPCDYYYSMESPSAQLPAREAHSAAIMRNYIRVGGKARRASFGFAPNRRCPNPPGGHIRRRDGSLRSTEEGTGRPLRFTDGAGG